MFVGRGAETGQETGPLLRLEFVMMLSPQIFPHFPRRLARCFALRLASIQACSESETSAMAIWEKLMNCDPALRPKACPLGSAGVSAILHGASLTFSVARAGTGRLRNDVASTDWIQTRDSAVSALWHEGVVLEGLYTANGCLCLSLFRSKKKFRF